MGPAVMCTLPKLPLGQVLLQITLGSQLYLCEQCGTLEMQLCSSGYRSTKGSA